MERISVRHVLRGGTILAAGFLLAAVPVQLRFGSGSEGAEIGIPVAHAKDGREDREDRSGRSGRDDSGRDDSRSRSDDSRDHDRSSRDDSRDRDRSDSDDSHDRGRSGSDDSRDRSGSDGSRDRTRSGSGDSYEVTLSDGSRVEVENGRYERRDAGGRTVEERPATAADRALVGGSAAAARAGRRSHTRGGGVVARLEASGNNIEITYDDGWKEEISNGIYELKDDLGRTVIERPAKPSDSSRLFGAVR